MIVTCKNYLREGFDPLYSGYLGDVVSVADGIDRGIETWSKAIYECAKAVIPASTAALAAQSAFESAAVGMYASGAVFSAAVAAFAAALGGGMVGYTSTPPGAAFIPVSINQVHEDMCADFSTQLIAWLQTGTATLIAPPNTVSNWS